MKKQQTSTKKISKALMKIKTRSMHPMELKQTQTDRRKDRQTDRKADRLKEDL